jgi:hypothetical protein
MNEIFPSENSPASYSLQQRVDEVCERFEAACQAGQRPRMEE